MTLKEQKKSAGRQKNPWTIEEVEKGLRKFFEENGRYPTATEIDLYQYLPSARTLERNFGGIVALRGKLKLGTEHDFRRGSHSSRRAYTINKRAHILEQEVYEYLSAKFNKKFVHREYLFTDDGRSRTDFFVYDDKNGFSVDVFYPSSIRNLSLCLNVKLKKYDNISLLMKDSPIIFLQMNKDISQEEIDDVIKNRKRSMLKDQYTMSWETFSKFCASRNPIKSLKD